MSLSPKYSQKCCLKLSRNGQASHSSCGHRASHSSNALQQTCRVQLPLQSPHLVWRACFNNPTKNLGILTHLGSSSSWRKGATVSCKEALQSPTIDFQCTSAMPDMLQLLCIPCALNVGVLNSRSQTYRFLGRIVSRVLEVLGPAFVHKADLQ